MVSKTLMQTYYSVKYPQPHEASNMTEPYRLSSDCCCCFFLVVCAVVLFGKSSALLGV